MAVTAAAGDADHFLKWSVFCFMGVCSPSESDSMALVLGVHWRSHLSLDSKCDCDLM